MLDHLFVFDIETVPDIDVCNNLFKDFDDSQDFISRREALENYHLEITGGQNSFLRQPFHKIVAISFLKAEIISLNGYESFKFHELRSGGNLGSTEKELVKGFFNYLKTIKPRLVSFNGRTFDLPVLKYRAMAHGIQAEFLYKSGDKWNNYLQRYSPDWHCDLLEVLSDFGSSARIKMNEVCAVLNFPGKLKTDGSKVTELYDEKKIEEIRNYCETDVLNTYLVYLRLMHHQGRITCESYNKSIKEILSHIHQTHKTHLLEFEKEWQKSCNKNFYL